jgi:high-affinity Fe2+/Pb2+ permease
MKTVKFDVKYIEKASRLELLVRILYSIPLAIVLWLIGIIASLAEFLLWFHILIFGRRHKGLNGFLKVYLAYVTKIRAYLNLLTDERPPIIPDKD